MHFMKENVWSWPKSMNTWNQGKIWLECKVSPKVSSSEYLSTDEGTALEDAELQ